MATDDTVVTDSENDAVVDADPADAAPADDPSPEDKVRNAVQNQGWSESTARRYFGEPDPEAEATLSADTAVGYANVEEREPVTAPQKEAAAEAAREEAIAEALAPSDADAVEAAPAES